MLRETLNYWWVYLVKGILAICFAVLALTMPDKTVVLLSVLFGLYLVIDGIISAVFALFSIGKGKNWGMPLLQGIVELLIGILVLNYPQATVGFVLFLVALWLIMSGIIMLIMGIKVRDESEEEWLLMAYGIIALFLGIILMANPQASVLFLTVMFGISALVSGIVSVSFAFKVRELKHRVEAEQLELPL